MKLKAALFSLLCFGMLSGLAACDSAGPAHTAAPTVVYSRLTPERVELAREFPGRVTARRMAEVRPQVGGILRQRLFEEGDEVVKGQPLYKIDEAPFLAAYKEAAARLARAESREEAARKHMERCILLAQKHAVRLKERDDAIAAYREVKAEIAASRELVEKAAIELGYATVRAPLSGVIGRSLVKEGALLSESHAEPLAVITQLDPVYVDVAVSPADRAALEGAAHKGNTGKTTKALADILPEGGSGPASPHGKKLAGELLFSEAEVDEATGTVITRVRCDNPERLLLPGMFVRARLPLGTLDEALTIPQRSVARDTRNRPVVYVLVPEQEGLFRLEERHVDLQVAHEGKWLVTRGLKAGELLLVEGLHNARHGRLVRGEAREGAGV